MLLSKACFGALRGIVTIVAVRLCLFLTITLSVSEYALYTPCIQVCSNNHTPRV